MRIIIWGKKEVMSTLLSQVLSSFKLLSIIFTHSMIDADNDELLNVTETVTAGMEEMRQDSDGRVDGEQHGG